MRPVVVECLLSPAAYPAVQLELALRIAATLGRGRLVLLEAPKP